MEVYLPKLPFSMHKLPNLFYRLQFQMQGKDVPNYLSDFSQKISAEELAIGSEIKRYKLNYLNKAVERTNVACFVRFSRELQLLIISYCKNISFVAPQNLPPAIQELALLFDDLLSKFQHFSLKYHEKGEHSPQQQKGPNLSQLCAVCSQQMKKVSLEKMRSSLMNELDLSSTQKYEESESGRQEEDAQFFEQVNKLLVMKQGELLKNQVEINNYKDVALNALEFLKTLKGYFARESLVLPSSAWVASAKQEMQNVLRQNFKGKIPPWIGKMLKVFCRHYESEMEGRGSEVGTQTDSQLQAEISQLRRKVVVAREKLHSQQSRVKWQQKQLVEVRGEKGNLQGKIEYYKAELNRLMEEIGNARMENQILTMKLNNARFGGDNNSNAPSNQDVSRDFSHPSSALRMPSSLRCEQGGLPKIKGKSDSKNQRHIRTSIKVNLSSSHSLLQSKKSTRRFDRGTDAAIANSGSVASGHANKDQITVASPHHLAPQRAQRQSKGKNSNLSSLHSRPHSVINEEFGELTMDQYRLKIKEVDQHMKTAIEQAGFSKNRQKHFFSTVSQHSELKRVPRRTLKAEDFDSTHQEPKTVETSLKKNNGSLLRLSKVYNYLSDSGYLIKITQKDFKEQISKLKLLDDPLTQPNSLSNTKRAVFKSRKYIFEKDCFLKRSLYEQSSDQDSKLINDSLDLSIGQNVANNYLMLFISAQNAFVYESNLTKNHSNFSPKLSPAEQHLCQQLYELISQIKADSIEHYKAVCSFIRFPYQVISNSLGSLSLGNDMKYVTFQHYFQRILEVHEKCKKQEGLCQHLREFKGRLAETDKAQPA